MTFSKKRLFNHPDVFDSFIVTSSNVGAYNWLQNWPESLKEGMTFLFGPRKSGKKILAKDWAIKNKAQTYTLDNISFSESFECFVLFLPEILSEDDQKNVFHFYNAYKNKTILFVGYQSPADIPLSLMDLRSRLLTCHQIEISAPDAFLEKALYNKLFDQKGIKISDDVVDYLIKTRERDYLSIYNIVEALDKQSFEEGRSITIPFIQKFSINQ